MVSQYNSNKIMTSFGILSAFPVMFYIIGLFQSTVTHAFKGWITWVITGIGLSIYLVFYLWFTKELNNLIETK